ncbi:MAG: alpha/beta fold hydrolase [Solirubrobacteraceae bacterium]
MRTIELTAGTIEYEDTAGTGPVVVLLHGLLMDQSLWADVVEELSVDHRCIVPTLPLGAHRVPISDHADLSLRAVAALVGEFIDRLDLREVTLVGNDTGGALVQLIAAERSDRLAGIVLVSCDAFDNYPPGLTGKALVLTGKLAPRLFGLFMQQMRFRPIRRLPIAFGWMTKRGDKTTKQWLRPVLARQEIRRDTVRVLRSISAERGVMVEAAEALADFHGSALVVWAAEDRIMPPEHGRRLVELLPNGRLVEIADSYTLIPLDQPGRLARSIRSFIYEREDRNDGHRLAIGAHADAR